ncbi:MAG: L-threonylcarbamoyladenylate synthase [Gammaproteobacteria bacterium]|nr:L-threonylcarbamoyladenylate synthase [Gammaproteobacteria bacterium]MDD9897148.1 L-threonylcarbamoyladenylate synthase [Gammaproteobacteria bacterium]MDD9958077.1 L-threonylcarbamoyladenylate synthase [Gammaproteobacteria bacterium]
MGNLDLSTACDFLKQGKLIAYPTEAVWGFGCDPFNEAAVLRILAIKQRPVEKGLILVAAGSSQIAELLEDLPETQKQLLADSWPGPTTWLIPDPKNLFPVWVKGTHKSIAIRVSAHPLVQELCKQYGKPIVSTSANTAGEEEIRSRLILEEQFADRIDYIVEGELGDRSVPSQIRDLISGAVLR